MELSNIDDTKEIEILKEDPKIQAALRQCSTHPKVPGEKKTKSNNRSIFGVTAIILLVCTSLYFISEWDYLPLRNRFIPLIQKLLLGTIVTTIVLLLIRLIKKAVEKKIEDPSIRYNLKRIADLSAAIIIFFVLLSLLFANWYATMVSFGIISLILGLALQNPITSFFAWIYILIRKPYEVGDRIRIGEVKGDIIDVGYFDTTLWEFDGEYLSGDHPSGRIVRFSNSKVFNAFIYNYSWPLFPFIWNEIKIFVSYESDLNFVSEKVIELVEADIGEAMVRRVKRLKKILEETPIDNLEVREYPSIIMRSHENTWVEVVVRYLVEPKQSGMVKNRIFKKLMEELRKHPDKVMFPKTNMR